MGRFLAAPADLLKNASDLAGRVRCAKVLLDDLADALAGPHVAAKAERLGSFSKKGGKLFVALFFGDLGRATRTRSCQRALLCRSPGGLS